MAVRSNQRSWVLKATPCVNKEESWESGWLSGFLDGEGHITKAAPGLRLGASQNHGEVLDLAVRLLEARGFKITVKTSKPCATISVLGGLRETLRLLMLTRPVRLLANYNEHIENVSLYGRDHSAVGLVSKEYLGEQEVVALSTTSRTFIAEGLASHNCNVWRAIQKAPDEVAKWCDWPVNEADLHARHRWLVVKGATLLERLIDDPDFYDARIAGWWIWGICTWIGNGWCHKDERVQKQKRRPELNAANGRGVHVIAKADTAESAADDCQYRPHLSSANGQGIHAVVKAGPGPINVPQYHSLPKIGTPGHGIHAPSRKMPRNARGAAGILSVAPASGKKPLTPHRNKGVHRDATRHGLEEVFQALCERLRHVRGPRAAP